MNWTGKRTRADDHWALGMAHPSMDAVVSTGQATDGALSAVLKDDLCSV